MQAPVMVMSQNTKRESGKSAQLSNIAAAKAVSDIIRTTLGPRSMLKMLLDPMGGIVMTNDGNAILREIDVSHPAAKSMIELSRAQDEEVGDGTTSVIILAGEMLTVAQPFLDGRMHPTVIVRGYNLALQAAVKECERLAVTIDPTDRPRMRKLIATSIGTKFSGRWGDMLVDIALDAVTLVKTNCQATDGEVGKAEVDIKRYAKVEKIPGAEVSDCRVLQGVMFNKDVVHSKMKRRLENPRILLLDCPLEYKKGESAVNIEVSKEEDWSNILKQEEDYIEQICSHIVAVKPDIVITEKGLSDLAQHYFVKHDIVAFRRLRKTDNLRVARATGATIVSRPDEIKESDLGLGCGLFHVEKIGDEYFTFLEECKAPKACSIVLRGGSKDVLSEVERNLDDAMKVARNLVFDPRLLPGGGATEMAVGAALTRSAASVEGVEQGPYRAVGAAVEVIPRTLAQNCGADTVRVMTGLRAKHAEAGGTWGINGTTGKLQDMEELGIWEPMSVKVQTIKTSIEAASMLLRIDDIVSGMSHKQSATGGGQPQIPEDLQD